MTPGTAVWFARHESRLAWRDWLSMITAGRRERLRRVVFAILVFAIFMHFVAYWMVGRYADTPIDKPMLVTITATVLLSWLLMISQAMESMTRAFYARSDLDLILASPVAAQRLFAVRIATVGVSVAMMAIPLAAPFIDILIVRGGLRWMGAYGLIVAMGAAAAALAVGFTVALFRIIGPRRTRLVAQVVAAVIGAAFVIGLQVAAILSYGTISRVSVLQSSAVLTHAPDLDSIVWWPARAAMGDWLALIGVLAVSLCAACCRHRAGLAALRRICHRSRRRRSGQRQSNTAAERIQKNLAAPRFAPQGMDAAAARSVAGVADFHADALSDPARRAAVAQL